METLFDVMQKPLAGMATGPVPAPHSVVIGRSTSDADFSRARDESLSDIASVNGPVPSNGRFRQAIESLRSAAAACTSLDVEGARLSEAVELLTEIKRTELAISGAKLVTAGYVDQVHREQVETFQHTPEGNGKRPQLPGQDRTLYQSLTRIGKQSTAESAKELKQARAAASYPLFREALQRGQTSASYLDVLTSLIGADLADQARVDEAKLLKAAVNEPVIQFRKTVRAWLVTHRPQQAEEHAAAQREQQHFSIFPHHDGYKVSGWFTAMDGTKLKHAIREIVGVPSRDDQRDTRQRNADALVAMADRDAMAGRAGASSSDGTAHGAGTASGNGEMYGQHGDNARGRPQHTRPHHEILVHVPLSTLIQTEAAIDTGCRQIEELEGQEHGETGLRTGASKQGRSVIPRSAATGTRGEPTGSINEMIGSGDRTADSGSTATGSASTTPDSGSTATGSGSKTTGLGNEITSSGNESVSYEEVYSTESRTSTSCRITGGGLGHQGACLGVRENLQRDLGKVLAMIRSGLDVSMLEGFMPATLPDGNPLAPSELAGLLCDSNISRLVLSAHGEPIDISRKQRLFSTRQAKAITARDRYCRYPGCDAPPELGQIHHAHQHERGGPTTIDNGILLCYAHHQVIHRKQITITHHQGGFSFTLPSGELVGISRHRAGTDE